MIPVRMFEGEKLLSQAGNDDLVLTTHRLRTVRKTGANQHLQSIFLEDISSMAFKINFLFQRWLILAAVAGILTMIFFGSSPVENLAKPNGSEISLMLGIFLFLLVVAYFLSLKRSVRVTGIGGEVIFFKTSGSTMAQIFQFIESVEAAKNERIKHISS